MIYLFIYSADFIKVGFMTMKFNLHVLELIFATETKHLDLIIFI